MSKLLAIALSLVCLAAQANYSQHHEYLSKIIQPASTLAPRIISTETQLENWFMQADKLLNPNELGTYKASFLMSFDRAGYIDALSIKDLTEDDFDKFKNFIAKLLSIKFEALPTSINPESVLEMDGELLYLARPAKPQTNPASTIAQKPKLELDKELELELVHPHHIDYPVIGEAIKFKLKNDSIIETQVLSYDQKFLYLSLSRGEENFYQDTVLRVARPKKNHSSIAATAITSGIVSAASTGLTASSLSYGIAPGAFGLAGINSSLLKSKQDLVSFNISRGDKLTAERGEKTRGEKK